MRNSRNPLLNCLEGWAGMLEQRMRKERKARPTIPVTSCGIHARDLGRVFLTFDQLRGQSGARVAAELILRGGKVVQIRNGPEQPLMKALGRLLFHYPEWQPFLVKRDGVAVVSDIRNHCKLYTPHGYSQTIRDLNRPHFDEYLSHWEAKGVLPPRRRQRKPIPQQAEMFNGAS